MSNTYSSDITDSFEWPRDYFVILKQNRLISLVQKQSVLLQALLLRLNQINIICWIFHIILKIIHLVQNIINQLFFLEIGPSLAIKTPFTDSKLIFVLPEKDRLLRMQLIVAN